MWLDLHPHIRLQPGSSLGENYFTYMITGFLQSKSSNMRLTGYLTHLDYASSLLYGMIVTGLQ